MKNSGISIGPMTTAGAFVLAIGAASAQAQSATERSSISATTAEGNDDSDTPVISADGRYVAFRSSASDLVPGDTNGMPDIFVRDRWTGEIERVSVSSSGAEANGRNDDPAISGDGRYVVFSSAATVLVPGIDNNNATDIYMRDRLTHTTTIVSRIAGGTIAGNGNVFRPRISRDGRWITYEGSATNLCAAGTTSGYQVFRCDTHTWVTDLVSVNTSGASSTGFSSNGGISADGMRVAFTSSAPDLIVGDTNATADAFVRDYTLGTMIRVSVSVAGAQANGPAFAPCTITPDGRYVAFSDTANNLAPGEFGGGYDIFVRDMTTGVITFASRNSQNFAANGNSYNPSISDDGRFVAFESFAPNLDPLDTDTLSDVFVRDLLLGTTVLASRSSGQSGNGNSYDGRLSADGSLVAFQSESTNLVPSDGNAHLDAFVRDLGTENHTAFCAGTSSGCPCGNAGLGAAGCENSLGTGGGLLRGFGTASVLADHVTLLATGLPPSSSSLFFQGTSRSNSGSGRAFGDGLQCAGGTNVRMGTRPITSGVACFGWPTSGGTPLVHIAGQVPAVGGTRTYQVWYRNSASFCTASTFNLTNGVEIVWTP